MGSALSVPTLYPFLGRLFAGIALRLNRSKMFSIIIGMLGGGSVRDTHKSPPFLVKSNANPAKTETENARG
jgi:hypothetical protein